MSNSNHSINIEFCQVPDFPAYRVSRCGRIQSCWKNLGCGDWSISDEWHDISKNDLGPCKYKRVVLRNEYKKIRISLHVLIANIFIGPCPEGMEVCHEDGDKSNNNVSNLRYDTRLGNVSDTMRHGRNPRGETHPLAVLDNEDIEEIMKLHKSGLMNKDIAEIFDVSRSLISGIVNGKRWKNFLKEKGISHCNIDMRRHVVTDGNIDLIRDLYDEGWTQTQLAERFNLGQSHISRIIRYEVG